MLAFINWDPSCEIFNILGISVRWYGLLFACAFLLGYKLTDKMFKSEGLPQPWLEKLFLYVMIATVAGARIGHCLFYDFAYFKDHIIEIFLPVRFEPTFKFIGYQGLASHGAAIGIIIALWYYTKKVSHKSFLWILDRVVLPVALAAIFIRTGNLINSEIIGTPTDLPWGFRFIKSGVSDPLTPRHPAQLYEAICYTLTFITLMFLYWKTECKKKEGILFSVFLIMIFTARFFVEFVKENQEAFEQSMSLNMGQILSIPFVLIGLFILFYKLFK
ncbi:prolipoprotein diacylglyceryl transferase [Marinilabiliaceae bacterium JC040]|nr:prolipoprotein diacylglyceryl transferase [Marinilabiliaceae bacterium JC040]